MRNIKPPQFISLKTILVAVLTAAILLSSVATKANMATLHDDEDNFPPLIDGVWVGAFSGSDAIMLGTTYAEAHFDGTLNFEVIAGEVLGDFTSKGFSSAENEEAYAIADTSSKGLLQGTAEYPTMLTTLLNMDMTVLLKGDDSTVNNEVTLTEGFSELDMTLLTSANCNQVSGNFDSGAMQNFNENNVSVGHLKTEFTATRVSGIYEKDPKTYQQELAQLLKDADQLITDTKASQTLDAEKLFQIMMKAAYLDFSVTVDKVCSNGKGVDLNQFASSIIGMIANLVNLAYEHPEWFTPFQLNHIAYAVTSVGAIGAGAADQALANDLTEKLEKITGDKIDYYDKNPDCLMIHALYTVAQFLTTDSLILKAEQVISNHQCQGN